MEHVGDEREGSEARAQRVLRVRNSWRKGVRRCFCHEIVGFMVALSGIVEGKEEEDQFVGE